MIDWLINKHGCLSSALNYKSLHRHANALSTDCNVTPGVAITHAEFLVDQFIYADGWVCNVVRMCACGGGILVILMGFVGRT